MRVVLDTNVVVSGVLRPSSVPAKVLGLIHEGRIRPAVDSRILAEYREVLARPRFKIPKATTAELLRRLAEVAEHVIVSTAVVSRIDKFTLRDPDDRPFMEVAVSAAVAAIITGNTNHYPRAALEPIRVLTPRQLLDEVNVAR